MSDMTLFERLWHYRYFGHVQRFHAERLIGEKPSVYHHSASVGIILIAILGEKLSVNLLKAALLHDMEEGITGDIPPLVKWAVGGIGSNTFALSYLERDVRYYFQIPEPKLTEEEKKYLKAADFLDAVLNCLEQRMLGNRFIDDCFYNYTRYAEESRVVADLKSNYGFRAVWLKVQALYDIENAETANRLLSKGNFWER